MSMNDVLSAIDAEIALIEQARNLLTDSGTTKRGKKPATKRVNAKRTFSPVTRKRMAEAQRKRWEAVRKAAE
jgi:rhamnose utilization protein RhaD (predicted bifunctional aldolase and dehydrogenase)